MNNPLKDKVAIVTGASSGIGLSMARTLGEQGCRVVAAAREKTRLNQVAQEIGNHALAVATDVSDREAVDRLTEAAVNRFGGIDILFANAGVFSRTAFADINKDMIDDLIDVNVRGVMHCVHAALPHLRTRAHGDILIVGSIAGATELPNQAVYSPTKYALRSFAHILRRQLRNDGIRVGLISPGTVATPLWSDKSENEVQAEIERHQAVRAEDVADAAMFMLTRPRHVAIRDVVILPQCQDI